MRVVVASQNCVKVSAARKAFAGMFPSDNFTFIGVGVESGVSDQPMTDDETLRGATNRAKNAQSAEPVADYWVGIEGGLERKAGVLESFGWMVVVSKNGAKSVSRTSTFVLPAKVAKLIDQGMELGDADDAVFHRVDSKHSHGTVGVLTEDFVTRESYYEQALALALIPYKNSELYEAEARK